MRTNLPYPPFTFLLLGIIAMTTFQACQTPSVNEDAVIRVVYDKQGVPYYNYAIMNGEYAGLKRNPLFICNEAKLYLKDYKAGDSNSLRLFFNCADWLMDNMDKKDNFGNFLYEFDYPSFNQKAPWYSALANARGLETFLEAHRYSHDQKYLDAATLLMNSLDTPVADGGVMIETKDGYTWFEEYPDPDRPSMVLNGMISVLIALHRYHEYTQDPKALRLLDAGIATVRHHLPEFDKDGQSYYDMLGREAAPSYHRMHVGQLSYLYNITQDTLFKHYQDKWMDYYDTHLKDKHKK